MSLFATIEEGHRGDPAGPDLAGASTTRTGRTRATWSWPPTRSTPESVNFMATHGRGLICMPMTGERLDELKLGMMVTENTAPMGTAFTVTVDARRGVTTGTSAYDRAVTSARSSTPDARGRPHGPGPHLPAAGQGGRRPAPGRPHRGRRGPGPAGRLLARRCDLRGARRDGGMARLPELRALARALRAQDDHHQGPHRVPHPQGEAGAARAPPRGCPRTSASSPRTPTRPRCTSAPHLALVMGDVTGDEPVPGAHALRVPHRRRVPLAALRLRLAAARRRMAIIKEAGPGRHRVPAPGRARHRAAQQAPRLRAAGSGHGHGRGQPGARLQGRPARLRHRRADPRRPRTARTSDC